ncbi:MAG: DUF1905 domain-containing protein [Akkermansiaceae bacterium]|nr:DUF1905 domain-containing protein [Akkermansiaceae bacterium]MCP5551210.1 DUF1905 domain-containing protein [Akkermansiaceae bacterium]
MKPRAFTSRVERLDDGMRFHVIPVPDPVAEAFREAGHRRAIVEIGGHAFNRAILNSATAGWHLVLGQAELKAAGVGLGDPVAVRLTPDPEPDRVEVSEEFRAVLEQDPGAAARWHGMTPGRQRSLAVHLNGAKSSRARLRRALDIAEKLRTHTLHGDRPPGRPEASP